MSNQNSTSGGHVSLETALQTCEAEVRKAIARAEAVDPASDEYGHAADNAYMRAMKFLKMTAKLGMALAKLKGEHTSNIRIVRTEEKSALPPARPAHVKLPPKPVPVEIRVARSQQIYDDWIAKRGQFAESAPPVENDGDW